MLPGWCSRLWLCEPLFVASSKHLTSSVGKGAVPRVCPDGCWALAAAACEHNLEHNV